MTGRHCYACPRPATELEHVVGRGIGMAFAVPICHNHHELSDADDWNIAGIPDHVVPPTRLHAIAIGLDRVAMLVGRAADAPMLEIAEPLLRPLAAWLAAIALELTQLLVRLDQGLPGYRGVLNGGG